MVRSIAVPGQVKDLYGLYVALRRSSFAVRNVGADERSTYVYLEESEGKDPVPIVESWLGRPVPEVTQKVLKDRVKELEELSRKEAEERLRQEADERARTEKEAAIDLSELDGVPCPVEEAPSIERKGGIIETLRRILGI